ncbi:MAG: hypothetical protein ABIY55_10520 [Kofleriaceae bacterium]
MVRGDVLADREQPGRERPRGVVALEVIERAQEGLLGDVLGVRGVGQPAREEGHQARAEAHDQLVERDAAAGTCASRELLGGDRGLGGLGRGHHVRG